MLRESSFVEQRSARWERLETLLGAVEHRGLGRLEPGAIGELARAYRATTNDLAAARSRAYAPALQAYLNRLVARAHATVYRAGAGGGASRLWQFYRATFPREVRASAGPILVCVALFVASALVAYALVSARPLDAYALLGGAVPLVQRSLHDSNFALDTHFSSLISSEIITNNVRAAMLAFAGGMTGGLLTLWVILENGLVLGAVGALFAHAGFGLDFWATVAPHGVLELTAIQIAGGAGLLIAAGYLLPGRLRRVDALAANGRRAAVLMVGAASLLIVAGLIEGFFTPLRTPPGLRIGVGALTAALLFPYLSLAGRASR